MLILGMCDLTQFSQAPGKKKSHKWIQHRSSSSGFQSWQNVKMKRVKRNLVTKIKAFIGCYFKCMMRKQLLSSFNVKWVIPTWTFLCDKSRSLHTDATVACRINTLCSLYHVTCIHKTRGYTNEQIKEISSSWEDFSSCQIIYLAQILKCEGRVFVFIKEVKQEINNWIQRCRGTVRTVRACYSLMISSLSSPVSWFLCFFLLCLIRSVQKLSEFFSSDEIGDEQEPRVMLTSGSSNHNQNKYQAVVSTCFCNIMDRIDFSI